MSLNESIVEDASLEWLGDLVARPVGMSVLEPNQPNRAVDIIRPKLMAMNGRTMGWGLKCFP